ncbi:MAG: hypothetical protein Q9219_001412 [cf. Caloplaca sp. 3 TL-2023]
MEELTLDRALARTRSNAIRERADGLAGIGQKWLSDKAYHQIFEALFKLAKLESSTFSRSKGDSQKSGAASRLSACANTLRSLVEIGVHKLRLKTVKALLDHVTQTLPATSGGYCEPLIPEYFRISKIILEYSAHTEHLSADEWHDLVDFFIQAIKDLLRSSNYGTSTVPDANEGVSVLSGRLSRSVTPAVHSAPVAGRLSGNLTRRPRELQLGTPAENVILCLRCLTSASNSPVLEKAGTIVKTMLDFLSTSSHGAPVQQAAFSTMNVIISRIYTNNVSLTLQTVSGLVPIIRRLWSVKSSTFKDQMLVPLLLGELYLPQVVPNNADDESPDLLSLVDVMRDEYCRRHEREQLQIDDLDLTGTTMAHQKERPFATSVLRLRFGAGKTESAWSLLYVSASITAIFHRRAETLDSTAKADGAEHAIKRRKVERPVDNILQQLRLSTLTEKIHATQLLCFLFDMVKFEPPILLGYIETILQCVSDKNSSLSSWAMLAITSAAGQNAASDPSIDPIWIQIWRVAARHLTMSNTCRAACQLMTVLLEFGRVSYIDVVDIVDGMISSMDLSGPMILMDSALTLCSTIALQRGQDNSSLAAGTADCFLTWLFHTWKPSLYEDRRHLVAVAQRCSALDIVKLLEVCIGNAYRRPILSDSLSLDVLGQARFKFLEDFTTIQYLLLEFGEHRSSTKPIPESSLEGVKMTLTGPRKQALMAKTLDFLVAEVSTLIEGLNASLKHTAEVVNVITTLCLVSYSFLADQHARKIRRHNELEKGTRYLFELLLGNVRHGDQGSIIRDGLLEAFAKVLPNITELLTKKSLISQGIVKLLRTVESERWFNFLTNENCAGLALEDNEERIDSEFESQNSSTKPRQNGIESSSSETTTLSGAMTLRNCLTTKLFFISSTSDTPDGAIPNPVVTQHFVDSMVSLPPSLFICSRHFLRDLFTHDMTISAREATALFQYLGQEILQSYTFERSESAMGLSLDIVGGLVDLWTNSDNMEVSEAATDIYDWFITVTLHHRLASSYVLVCISILLQRLIRTSPDYGKSLDLPSPRTSLFKVLEDGNLDVKFSVGHNISEIFGLFVLKEHEHILEDVIDILPKAANWPDGIALRLYILYRLAQSWPTLLRRCVYAIFETPAAVPTSAGHAKWCLSEVSKSLKLRDPQELFKLFAPQILYTWLETQALESIAYSAFGYHSLKDLLLDAQDEIAGQAVMRHQVDTGIQLARDTGKSFRQVVEESIGKVAGYTIAQDVAVPPTKHPQARGAEAGLRQILGKEKYAKLVLSHFHDILLTFFKTMYEDYSIEKTFGNHPAFKESRTAYQEMRSISASTAVLPISQQPSFKARYVLDDIACICRRTGQLPESVWSAPLYVYVFRGLLDTIHPALGSQHACSVIRKLRVLVSIAGDTALQSYPLEMALQSLRPFLTDIHCSEDSIGIFQYLLLAGKPYLKNIPTFITGLGVVCLISLTSFLGLSQESTTQESQHLATMTQAGNFHKWLGAYMGEYDSHYLPSSSMSPFRRMIEAARNVRGNGNARVGSYESDLLVEVLDDIASGRKILNEPSQQLILGQLCTSFERPPNFREDVFGADPAATSFAPILWRLTQKHEYGTQFHLWVCSVLGRAYACTGEANKSMMVETDHPPIEHNGSAPLTSESYILQFLGTMLLLDDSRQVGIVEKTLRVIISHGEGTDLSIECEQHLPSPVIVGLLWRDFQLPSLSLTGGPRSSLEEIAVSFEQVEAQRWVQTLCVSLVTRAKDDALLAALPYLLSNVTNICESLFPFIFHLTLSREMNSQQPVRSILSTVCQNLFDETTGKFAAHTRFLLKAIIYLREQPLPQEVTKSDRSRWLDINYHQAASAAARCCMFKTALLFLDIGYSEAAKASRRVSAVKVEESTELLLQIYKDIDEEDAFYGVEQPSSLASMMARLEYERAGFKSLSFRGAHYDSQIRFSPSAMQIDEEGLVQALETLDLNGLSQSLLGKMTNLSPVSLKTMLNTARKLEQWDLSAPVTQANTASTVFRAFQGIHNAQNAEEFSNIVDVAMMETMTLLKSGNAVSSSIHETLGTLAILTEMEELCSVGDQEQLEDVWLRFEEREEWMQIESFDHVDGIVSCRETLFSTLSKSSSFQDLTRTPLRDARIIEARALLSSSQMSRRHGALQNALAVTTYLNRLVQPCKDLGIDISAGVQLESANVLWDQGEMTASINMLQDLKANMTPGKHAIHVGKPELLAKLGHQISEARLEKPDEIINHYLIPAIKELRGVTEGTEAGQVFHEFASFCDQQLQNPDSLEDFERVQKLRQTKEDEVNDLDRMIKSAGSQSKEKENLKTHRNKAKLWFDLDDREFQRLRDNRQAFLRQSVENYLLALKACDKYDNDALRFSALWLQHYDSEIANEAVAKHIGHVGSRKFASLMNQWSSRLLDVRSSFQQQLASLVFRICHDHPFHGMYQIFVGSKSRGGKDEVALGRNRAANKVVDELKTHKRCGPLWINVHNSNILYVRFAAERLDDNKIKPGSKVALRKSPTGQRLEQEISGQKVPPPTMKIDLRADCDYSTVPRIARFHHEFSVASGISMPKIISAIATDGTKYKQLFKSGNDDLRQDAIMEQVFEQVSNLLRAQRATRHRNLGIRTYKVLPLTATSGIIEFVQNTVPLHDYLMPAHARHFPRDLKPSNCRKAISDAQNQSTEKRIKTYRSVCNQFHPVLRYFFQEHFEKPDDWFDKRLAYTRSTAAISILGHILGLGDRHGHNILLDEKTGEVVHIDLGIAFEQGRVLPVPELVPFRLTRDVVDGMGITRTEGVFRRCCEFTLEALRNESYSIMTILDVLRYDPLYSWSLSPLRLKKMQEAQTEAPAGAEPTEGEEDVWGERKKTENEPGEADRALTVVKKKLSKSLSVTATVNELMQQATDERNLALLFAGESLTSWVRE